MGRSIYFTEQEILMLLDYTRGYAELLGESEENWEQTEIDMNNGLGSALRKLSKGRNCERVYAKYKTKRETKDWRNSTFIGFRKAGRNIWKMK